MKIQVQCSSRLVFVLGIILMVLVLPSTVFASDFPAPGDFAKGAASWANNCSRCHNMRDPQDLRDDQWVTTVFHMRVRAGLTGQQARDILTFLQESNNTAVAEKVAFKETTSSAASVLSGNDVYNQSCIACHGANGKGTVPGAPDFTQASGRLSQSDEVLLDHMSQGFQSPGSPMAMPPKGGNSSLTNTDLQAVLIYLRESFKN